MATVKLIIGSCTDANGCCCLWTVPTGVYQVTFEVWGGGGGGGTRGTSCNCCDHGLSGGGGGYSKKTISATPGSQYTVCAGGAGTATSGYGSLCARCCNGCTGGTSYVTGTNLSNFCATGGQGGYSDFTSVCYANCGCNGPFGGLGYNGDVVATGSNATIGMFASSNPYNIQSFGGNAGGIGGGVGGTNLHGGYYDGSWEASGSGNKMHGMVPGGGGAGSGLWSCCACTAFYSGRGAPGAVKITY